MTSDSLLGQQLDEYRLEALLGRGGMARVYRGLDTRLGRYAAVKVIDTPLRTDSEYARRFELEAQAIARLEHPHIVRLYRYGEAQGVLYMAMQYVEGADLGLVLGTYQDDHEFIEPDEASRVIRQVGLALDYAHDRGVIHRDIKPSNILLDREGQVFLTDFGLALLTEIGTRGEIFGSPHYIAPEQAISSAGAVPQSDLYAVGIILYEMFTGRLPYDAENPMDIAMLHMDGQAVPPHEWRPDLSPQLGAVILKAMAREPAERYPSGAALSNALDRALQAAPGSPPARAATTLRQMSVPDRVAVELDAHPLPPLPAEATPPANDAHTLLRPAVSPPPALPSQPRTPVRSLALIGIGVTAAVVFGWAVVLYLLLGNGSDDKKDEAGPALAGSQTALFVAQVATEMAAAGAVSPTIASETPSVPPAFAATATPLVLQAMLPTKLIAPTVTIVLPPATVTPIATLTRAPTLTPLPSATPPALTVPPEHSYEALIERHEGEGLIIVNASPSSALPLGRLRLGDGSVALRGADWDIGPLAPNECVVVWVSGKDTPDISDMECRRVGPVLRRDKHWRLWDATFNVYYTKQLIGLCERNTQRCSIPIAEFDLLIAYASHDSLFVVNVSADPIPLALLRLGDGAGAINGSEWDHDSLAPKECVTVWKAQRPAQPPDVTCQQVGQPLTRRGTDRFWTSAFAVYYRDERVATCDTDTCAFTLP